MPRHDTIAQQVLSQLVAHAGLRLPDVNVFFILEAYVLLGEYSGILYQEGTVEGKFSLVPIGCISTTKKCKLESEVEQMLAAALSCL